MPDYDMMAIRVRTSMLVGAACELKSWLPLTKRFKRAWKSVAWLRWMARAGERAAYICHRRYTCWLPVLCGLRTG